MCMRGSCIPKSQLGVEANISNTGKPAPILINDPECLNHTAPRPSPPAPHSSSSHFSLVDAIIVLSVGVYLLVVAAVAFAFFEARHLAMRFQVKSQERGGTLQPVAGTKSDMDLNTRENSTGCDIDSNLLNVNESPRAIPESIGLVFSNVSNTRYACS